MVDNNETRDLHKNQSCVNRKNDIIEVLDLETIYKHDVYVGERIKRGIA